MKPVIKQEDAIYYVSESDVIQFISDNAPIGWNECCDYVRDQGITGEEGRAMWTKNGVFSEREETPAVRWVREWFNAHPWMEKVMFVFDD